MFSEERLADLVLSRGISIIHTYLENDGAIWMESGVKGKPEAVLQPY